MDANEPGLFDLPDRERSATPKLPLRGRNRETWARTATVEVTIIDAGILHEAMARIEDDAVTISRELSRNNPAATGRRRKYPPYAAQRRAIEQGRRPKSSKFDNAELASVVQAKLCTKWSPEQVSDHLAAVLPDRQEKQVSPETIHQALYVQGRGHLRDDLHQHLRTGRAVRRPRRSTVKGPSGKIPNMILISERPAEVADRAVPGHW